MNNLQEGDPLRDINDFLDGNAIQDMEIEALPVQNPPRARVQGEAPHHDAADQPVGGRDGPNPARHQVAEEANLAPVRVYQNPRNAERVEELPERRAGPGPANPEPLREPAAAHNNNRGRFAPYRRNRAGHRVQRQRRAREFVDFLGMLRHRAFQG